MSHSFLSPFTTLRGCASIYKYKKTVVRKNIHRERASDRVRGRVEVKDIEKDGLMPEVSQNFAFAIS